MAARRTSLWLRVFMLVAVLEIVTDIVTVGALVTSSRSGIGSGTILGELVDEAFLGFMLVFAIAAFHVGSFLVRANRNSGYIRRPLGFSPASMVWWYFVPLLNLVRPYQCMRELWHGSFPESRRNSAPSSDLSTWWTLWLVGWLLLNIAGDRLEPIGSDKAVKLLCMDVLACACLLGAAALLRRFVLELSALQDEAYAERIAATSRDRV